MKAQSTLRIYIVIISIFIFTQSNAQSPFHCGPMAGIGYRTTTGPGSKTFGMGGYVGLLTNYNFSKRFSVQPGFSYAWKGYYYYEADLLFGDEWEDNLHLNYLNIVIPAKYTSLSGWFISAGPQIGILLNANYESTDGNDAHIKDKVNPVDYGIFCGGGYQLKNGLAFNINIEFGLNKIAKKQENENVYEEAAILGGKNLLITTGISYLIGTGKKNENVKKVN
jgi:hypothetical protein